ncbi:MAG: response regulator [Lachnospiraceae bacterium]|nr:response regulator [Lachnospiraceae bacterium]
MMSFKEMRERDALRRSQKKEVRKKLRLDRAVRLRWYINNILEYFRWNDLTKDQRFGRFFRDIYIVVSAIISILLFYFCFVVGQDNLVLSTILFCFYLAPTSICVILYGFGSSIMGFTIFLIAALFIEPSNVYLLFLNLVTLYTVWNLRQYDRCSTKKSVVLSSIGVGLILSGFYYLIFVMVGQASFVNFDIRTMLMHLVGVFPQAIFVCVILYVYRNKLSERTKVRLGVLDDTLSIKDELEKFREHKRKAKIGDKVFGILLVEAVILGVSAAAFANSLLPGMTGVNNDKTAIVAASIVSAGSAENTDGEASAVESTARDVSAVTDENTESDESNGVSDNNDDQNKNGFDRFMGYTGMENTYAIARLDKERERFKFSERGLAFDLKLIMMLLCVIHPIVFSANALAQIMITKPIEGMTDTMKGFNDDPDSRIKVGKELANLGIHTGDEIEELYGALYNTVGELNSYIDKIREEQKLREDLRVAKAASEAKSNFLSNVSHEIRTPINAVLGMDEMILRESEDKEIKKYAVNIKNSGKTLLALINDLLDFSKIEAGKMEILPVEYELSSVINDLINMVSSKAADKGLELKIDVDPTIPHVLFGDEIRVKQCILNILNNAVKYTLTGSVTMRLSSRFVSDDEIALKVNVIDTGIGIKEEDLSKLFSPFERIEETRNRTIEGTGLGMSIVKQLLDMMGTRLEVKSVYGEGSDFSFEVVQKVVKNEPIGDFNKTYEKSLESMQEYAVSFVAPDAKILVVDDTPMNLTVIRGLLKETLVNVDTATSGKECLEKVKSNKYDIIFMDQRMPEMDGTETLGHLKEMGSENLSIESPVIILTANVVSGAREGFIKSGFDDYLAKPIDAGKLEAMIAGYLPKEKVLDPGTVPELKNLKKNSGGSEGGAYGEHNSAYGTDNSANGPQISTQAPSDFETFYRNAENLSYEAGIAGCMNEDILKEAVHDFYVALKEGPDLIESLWKSGDIENYTIKVHALKSSARIIGATMLSEKAAFLEKCGDNKDVKKIDELTPELLTLYRSYKDVFSPLYEKEEEQDLPLIDTGELKGGYEALKEAVSAFDFDTADAIIGMLKAYSIPDEEKDRFSKLCDYVTALDRDKILELL